MNHNAWIDWLLQAQTASIRCLTLHGLLDLPQVDPFHQR